MNGIRYWVALIVFGIMFCQSKANANPYQLDRTQVLDIQSSINDKQYQLYVYTPPSYTTSARNYPLVVLNDAEFAFPLAVGAGRLLMGNDMQEVILVGISYSQGDTAGTSRTRDYTPTFAPDETSFHSVEAKAVSGRAKDYLKFIEQDALPLLYRHYRINKSNKAFVGHSFGGLLGAYTLLVNSQLFEHYVIGSPSLWYDDRVMFQLEEEFAKKHKKMPANVYFYVGANEDSNTHPMVTDTYAFKTRLSSREYEGLTLHVGLINDGSHHSAFPHLLTRALPLIFPLAEQRGKS